MACAIFYMHQTSGACTCVCVCNRSHQMEKSDIPPHDLPEEQEHSVSPHEVWGDLFLKKAFQGRWGKIFFWTNL